MDLRFLVAHENAWMPEPIPASQGRPSWVNEMPMRTFSSDVPHNVFPHATARNCAPFADALDAGYLLLLPIQIFVKADREGAVSISWAHEAQWNAVGTHAPLQAPTLQTPHEHTSIFKWLQPWGIELPEGYSALITHPANRADLPFQSFDGIVDDGYRSPVNVPFMWVSGEQETILDAGTPIAQVIPFRREDWKHEIAEIDSGSLVRDAWRASSMVSGYRRLFRKPKIW